ncbi:MAG: hypothetical protein HS132_04390 [Planctomycetia bacterium]|nr:hypothetical protein [Planctomycetia bacterium]
MRRKRNLVELEKILRGSWEHQEGVDTEDRKQREERITDRIVNYGKMLR